MPDGSTFWYQTIEIELGGIQQTIIPARTRFSIESHAKAKDEILSKIDYGKVLSTTFSFCDSELFISAGEPLFSLSGHKIPSDFKSDYKVYVFLDKADNIQLLGKIDVHHSEIVACSSVEDAMKRVSTSFYVSQVPNQKEWLGLAGANDTTIASIHSFAARYRISGTAAQSYFGVMEKTSVLQNIAIFGNQVITGARTKIEATKLYKGVVQAFGTKCAGQTRYIKGINFCVKQYGLETVVSALSSIGADEKLQVDAASCEDKASCLQTLLIHQIMANQANITTELAQAS